MYGRLLEILVCPQCKGDLTCEATQTNPDGEIETGALRCEPCGKTHPIEKGIPRFVSPDNYANSFGLQWNLFKSEQIDSVNGFSQSDYRFYSETEWPREWMPGKLVLDAGCGAGRFLDVVSKSGADVVGIDLSNAVDAARITLKGRKNVHLVQASIYELPFRDGTFDGVYCIGVIQHTPDPHRSLRSLPRLIKDGGLFATTIYERNRFTMLHSKYWVRPVTKRMSNQLLLGLLKITMPLLFPITEVTFRIPVLGKYFAFVTPVANYAGCNEYLNRGLTWRQRYRWSIMDTFDMLAPEYDLPQTEEEVRGVVEPEGIEGLRRTNPYALCLTGRKRGGASPPEAGS